VVDADALNNLAGLERWPTVDPGGLVLTPHPGEFARLVGLSVAQVQADRVNLAVRFAAEHGGLVLVLKGRGTVVTDGDRWYLNATGNPAMATGGAGDVLTGAIAALIGQGMFPFEAACLGAYVHGLAGDLLAGRRGGVGLIAGDLADALPEALAAAAKV
jgi:NAD(P)H-hydrate epimerase